jgi:hypothetical protein
MFQRAFIRHPYGSQVIPAVQITYSNSFNDHSLKKITLNLSPCSEGKTLSIELQKNNDAAAILAERLQNLYFMKSHSSENYYDHYSNEELVAICNLLFTENAIDEDTQNNLLRDFNFPVFSNDVHQEFLTIAGNGDIDRAKELAITADKNGYQDALWVLAEYLSKSIMDSPQDLINSQQSIELYKKISPNNPHFAEASEKLAYLYIQLQIHFARIHDPEIKEEQQKEILKNLEEEQFKHMLHMKKEPVNQRWIDRHFGYLCGGIGSDAEITQVRLDEDTLLRLAHQIKQLRSENLVLQKKPAQGSPQSSTNITANQSAFFSSSQQRVASEPDPSTQRMSLTP